jgi:hypothetical protein
MRVLEGGDVDFYCAAVATRLKCASTKRVRLKVPPRSAGGSTGDSRRAREIDRARGNADTVMSCDDIWVHARTRTGSQRHLESTNRRWISSTVSSV